MAYRSINPFTGELLQSFGQHTDAQMESALAKAESTFQDVWSKATFLERAAICEPCRGPNVGAEGEPGSTCGP